MVGLKQKRSGCGLVAWNTTARVCGWSACTLGTQGVYPTRVLGTGDTWAGTARLTPPTRNAPLMDWV